MFDLFHFFVNKKIAKVCVPKKNWPCVNDKLKLHSLQN